MIEVHVQDAEFFRLLGYPRGHQPEGRAAELAAWARDWYAEHGRPWTYQREVAGPERAFLVAVSAGPEVEEEAQRCWRDGHPDEYFFLEIFGSAVVEHLVAAASGRICARAEGDGLIAVPHYSPGYTGWDLTDQSKLLALIRGDRPHPFPETVEVLSSGMLRPKKSQLAVFGLTARTPEALASARLVPCRNCSFSPCQYRRARYRHAPDPATDLVPAS